MKRQRQGQFFLLLIVLCGILIIGFQNCSKESFSAAQQNASSATGTVLPGPSPGPAPAPAPLACPLGQTNINSVCKPCQNFVPLQAANGSSYSVPAADGNCYYIHIIDAVDLGNAVPTSTWLTNRPDIISRDHNVSHGNWSPFIIGSSNTSPGAVSNTQITLEGLRTVTLSGSASGNVNMLVDNFILLEMESKTFGPQNLGEGTADAPPWASPSNASSTATAPITISGLPIQYVSFGPSGTTDVTPVNISSYFPINDVVSLRTTGLDCGGVGDISDIYLLFQ